ncbi:hypothetical protein BpHYR1_004504 [Brachionus plicatilis]|uniref:SOCS box domain-containing protein n=1 Tax=Brachionus plicatilis TaxID=10195 RepID=A0A3M7SJ75_BRAPC|nr:hypothetical protein BpHYR1_004504 [Brachionus plicatilis]
MTIDEFFEHPRVEAQNNRNIIFPRLRWMSKSKFEEEINSHLEIHPCLNEDQPVRSRVFLGKLIPNSNSSILLNHQDQLTSELIGSVFYSSDKIWKLKITFSGLTHEIADGFLILSLQDSKSYFWDANDAFQNVQLPPYALKVSLDSSDSHYQYAGRRSTQTLNSRYSIIFYSNAWLKVEDQLELTFGKIKTDLRLLMVPYENMEIGHSKYEVLCLKASPACLQILCRSAIRKYVNRSQKNIKSLSSPIGKNIFLPNLLVNYLKYPSFLVIGDCMFKEEKLVHENDEYELFFDQENGDLMCKKLTECVDVSSEWIMQKNADCILLHPFSAVFYSSSKKKATRNNFTNSSDSLLPYKFFVNWDNFTFEIKYM